MTTEDSSPEDKSESATRSTAAVAASSAAATTAVAATSDSSRLFPFKNPNYEHKNIINGKRKPWRTLKQILAQVQEFTGYLSDGF